MAKVVLDVPTDKMRSFLKAILSLGIDRHAISPAHLSARTLNEQRKKIQASLKHIASSYILFDWEFFSNELEYE